MTALTLVTAPAKEPITIADAKAHLNVMSDDDDTLIEVLITAAREHAEAITKRSFITQTFDYHVDVFRRCIELPQLPLQSVTFVKYIDNNGIEQTVDTSIYSVDTNSEPGRIFLAYNQVWPISRAIPHAVTIEFVAGYGDDENDVPKSIIAAMKLVLGHLYENREESAPFSIHKIPLGIDALLGPNRVDMP